MIAIIDYGMGNVGSIANMIRKVGGQSCTTRSPSEIQKAEKLILPGVGHFDSGVRNLHSTGCLEVLNKEVLQNKKTILGICLGMQLMAKKSEEGEALGLGWVDAEVLRFNFRDNSLKVPHMGWNTIDVTQTNTLIESTQEEQRFYFVHSYYVRCNNLNDVIATSNYGSDFVCAFQKENVFGVQFHPEKSHLFGMKLLKRFVELEVA